MERRTFLRFTTSAALGSALTACGSGGDNAGHGPIAPPPAGPVIPPTPASRAALSWNVITLNAIRATATNPPVSARALAVVHTAMYDAWAAYDQLALSTCHGASMRRPVAEHTPAFQVMAFSFAAYAALADLFPGQVALFDSHMATLGYRPGDASMNVTTPAGIGTVAARSVLARAHKDGSNQLGNLTASGIPYADYSGYSPANAPLIISEPTARTSLARPDRWAPLAWYDNTGKLRVQTYMVPYWGSVRPFALQNGAEFRPAPPAVLGSAAFEDQARAMVATQQALTDREKAMADFWAGGSTGEVPAGYWSTFAQFVSERDGHDEAEDIRLFFALSNALFDAGIAAWDAKLAFDSARPISAVRYVMAGQTIRGYGPQGPAQGLRAIGGESWMPYQRPGAITPPFPDHVSGHSTYSAAAAEVLRSFTGSDVFNHGVTIPARSLAIEPAAPAFEVRLSWDTFTIAACEAGQSRVHAGIHFTAADLEGRVLGTKVGARAWQVAQDFWLGRTT